MDFIAASYLVVIAAAVISAAVVSCCDREEEEEAPETVGPILANFSDVGDEKEISLQDI